MPPAMGLKQLCQRFVSILRTSSAQTATASVVYKALATIATASPSLAPTILDYAVAQMDRSAQAVDDLLRVLESSIKTSRSTISVRSARTLLAPSSPLLQPLLGSQVELADRVLVLLG